MYEGIGDRLRRLSYQSTQNSTLWIRYIMLYIFCMVGFIASSWLQFHPYHFLPVPVLHQLPFPILAYRAFLILGIIYGCLTIIVIIPIFHCGGKQAEKAIAYRNEKILKYTEKEFNFRLVWYFDKLVTATKQLCCDFFCNIDSWWKFLSLFVVVLCSAPFAIINKLSLEYYAFRKADIIAYRLCKKFHCHSKHVPHSKAIIKAILYVISVLFCVLSMFLIWSTLQLIVRILITSIAFLVAHSNFFSSYFAPGFPFLYFAKQAIQSYSGDKIALSKAILELQEEIKSEEDNYLSEDTGRMEILFIVTPKGVEVDLPIRLENLREMIRTRLELLTIECETEFRYEQQSIVVKFRQDGTDGNGEKIYSVKFSQFNDYLNDLRYKIEEELSHQQLHTLQFNLKPFYYDLHDEEGELTDVGIPIEFYNYLSYQASGLATSFGQLLSRIIAIATIGGCFITAVASFNIINNINSLSNALSGTILSFVTMMSSMSYFTSKDLSESQKQQVLKKYILDYILGYNFFYSRGKTLHPCLQFHQTFYSRRTVQDRKNSSPAIV
ncbi:hypothetical protein TrispH2_012031 [Trichoplax sp. H2]|nr:hypothetical protein TrispH2_012031 [Trichoplax sp. H2]|eukprot:RDD36200.1 hypothetical protein TrispH2_012031 [Trichoplax sp. H2]